MAIYDKAPFKKVTEFTNSSVSKLIASKGSGKELPAFANNITAIAGGLVAGDLYQAAGVLMVVV